MARNAAGDVLRAERPIRSGIHFPQVHEEGNPTRAVRLARAIIRIARHVPHLRFARQPCRPSHHSPTLTRLCPSELFFPITRPLS